MCVFVFVSEKLWLAFVTVVTLKQIAEQKLTSNGVLKQIPRQFLYLAFEVEKREDGC